MPEEQDITAPLEAESLQAGWAAKSNARPRCYTSLVFGAKTDLGRVRENNEDKFDYLEPDEPHVLATKGRVYAVADGMGGHSAGQIASELSLNMFVRSYFSNSSADVPRCLTTAVREANAYVVDVARTVFFAYAAWLILRFALAVDNEPMTTIDPTTTPAPSTAAPICSW